MAMNRRTYPRLVLALLAVGYLGTRKTGKQPVQRGASS